MWSRLRSEDKAAILVALLTALVFLPSLGCDFIFDDVPLVSSNDWVHSWRWLGRAFGTHFWDVSLYGEAREIRDEALRHYYRPLVTVSYLVDWKIGGGQPWSFHLTNTILHAINGGLATRAAIRWTRSSKLGVACALLFAVHPTRTECVTWIAGRTDVMMMLCVLGALEAFDVFEKRRGEGAPRAWTFFGIGLAAFACGILCKEPAAMFPILALADRAARPEGRRSWLVPAVTGVLGGGYLLTRALFWMPESHVDRFLTPGHFLVTVAEYMKRVVLPWPPTMYYHALVIDDAGRPVYSVPTMIAGALIVIAMIAALVVAWRRARPAFWLLLSAAAFLGPLLNLWFTGLNASVQDRFLYAPLFGLATGLAVLFGDRLRALADRRLAPMVTGAVALAAVLVIEIRTLDYRSNEAFWRAEVAQNPDHPYALGMLGMEVAQRGDVAEAYRILTRIETPEAKKYRLVGTYTFGRAHFLRASMLSATMPDGRAEDLVALLDEMWRLVDPSFTPPRSKVEDYEIGAPITMVQSQRDALEKSFHWDMALLATRVGDMKRARLVADRASRDLLLVSSNPANGVLALARMGRLADAKQAHAAMRARLARGQSSISADALDALEKQLANAESAAAGRDRASDPRERATAEALRLAGLGAYFTALRALHDGGLFASADSAPLVTQLLVACRLDGAARAHAATYLGNDRATAIVAEITAHLDERVRAMTPVDRSFDEILEHVTRRTSP